MIFTACRAIIFASLMFAVSVARADDFRVPALSGPVVDAAGILNPSVAQTIETGLRRLRNSGGSQINVLTVPSLGGLEIEQASIKVTDAWKLGGEKTDNGILLLVAPTERRVRIEVGQGLEGTLTDAFSNRIVRDTILPEFRSGGYDRGVLLGLVEILRKTDPSVDAASLFGAQASRTEPRGEVRPRSNISGIFKLILFVIILIIFFSNRGGGGGRRRGVSPWAAGALGYGLGRSSGGGWGGGSGGGGGGWSGGGGGFSGGGASGGW